jgi:MurNAc alpha-1-phosphate uridylyltransferase
MADSLAAIVLGAGAGTRLRPLTRLRPKVLCPVANVTLVDRAIESVRPVASDVAVNVHHHRTQMEDHLAGRVHLSIEDEVALGTAGGVGNLRDWLDGRDALVVNGDAWSDVDLEALVTTWDHERVRLLVVDDPARGDFGIWRFAGASLLPWGYARQLPAEPAGLYEALWRHLHEQGKLDLVPHAGLFFDCGTPRDYLDANLAAAGGESVVAPDATVEGDIVRTVVWPGAIVRARERLVDAIRADELVTVLVR